MISMSNLLLEQTEQRIEGQLTPQTRANYSKIVVAGLRAALQGGPNSILASLKDSKDPIGDCVKGAISLVLILRKEARGVMPPQAMIPAMMTLLLKALDTAERAGMVKIDADQLAAATHQFMEELMPKLGLTPQKLQAMTEQTRSVMNDPQKMEQVRRAAGVSQGPITGGNATAAPAAAPPPAQPSLGLINGGGNVSA